MRCPHCGAPHQEDGFHCEHCNEYIEPIQPKTTKKSMIAGGIALVIVAIIGFVFIYMSSNKVGFFAEEEPQSFNDYSWEQIAEISSNMTMAGNVDGALREAKKHDFVNEDGTLRTDLVKDFTLADGTELQAHLVGVYHDPRTNNSGNAGMSFIVTVLVEEAPMNDAATNQGGWEASALRAQLNGEFFESLPADLQEYIVEVKKETNNTGNTESPDAVSVTGDKVWALSAVEFAGESFGAVGYANVLNAEGAQYMLLEDDAFKQDLSSKLARSGDLNWWFRSPNPETATQFFSQGKGYDTEQNAPESLNANSKLSVVIGFCI